MRRISQLDAYAGWASAAANAQYNERFVAASAQAGFDPAGWTVDGNGNPTPGATSGGGEIAIYAGEHTATIGAVDADYAEVMTNASARYDAKTLKVDILLFNLINHIERTILRRTTD